MNSEERGQTLGEALVKSAAEFLGEKPVDAEMLRRIGIMVAETEVRIEEAVTKGEHERAADDLRALKAATSAIIEENSRDLKKEFRNRLKTLVGTAVNVAAGFGYVIGKIAVSAATSAATAAIESATEPLVGKPSAGDQETSPSPPPS